MMGFPARVVRMGDFAIEKPPIRITRPEEGTAPRFWLTGYIPAEGAGSDLSRESFERNPTMSAAIQPFGQGVVVQNASQETRKERREDRRDEKQERRQDRRRKNRNNN